MATTRLTLKNNIASMCERPGDTDFLLFLNDRIDRSLDALFDMHDWNWKHKSDHFHTVSGTESYDLNSVTTNKNIRSSQDIELVINKTEGKRLAKTDLKEIRKETPKEDSSGKPTKYAPWGDSTVILDEEPDGIYEISILYLSKPTYPTDDGDTISTKCGIPEFMIYLLEKMILTEAMIIHNDNRRDNLMMEIERIWKPRAIKADMKHLESTARFKFWEEELLSESDVLNEFDPLDNL